MPVCFSCINMVVGLGYRKYSWVFWFNKDLVLDQQLSWERLMECMLDACPRMQYIEFRSLRISELSCMHYNENTGKPWIHQSFSAKVSKSQFCQKFLPPKFCTIRYVTRTILRVSGKCKLAEPMAEMWIAMQIWGYSDHGSQDVRLYFCWVLPLQYYPCIHALI